MSAPAAGSKHVSPFDADSARKGSPRQESASNARSRQRTAHGREWKRTRASGYGCSRAGKSARGLQTCSLVCGPNRAQPKLQVAPPFSQVPSAATGPAPAIEKLRRAVLQALGDGNQRILVSMLEAGEWTVEGNEVVIKVSESPDRGRHVAGRRCPAPGHRFGQWRFGAARQAEDCFWCNSGERRRKR